MPRVVETGSSTPVEQPAIRPHRTARLVALSVLLTLGALVAALLPASAASAAPVAPKAEVTNAHFWGIDAFSTPSDTIAKLQNKMSRKFGSFAVYSQLDQGGSYPGWDAREAMNAHGLIYLNINAASGAVGQRTPNCYANIVAGQTDTLIDTWVQSIRATHYENMIITFQHEQSVNSRMQPKCHTDTPSGYSQAFDYIFHKMRQGGITAPFAWVPTAAAFSNGLADQYQPPVNDYSIVGADAYAEANGNWRDAAVVLSPLFTWANANVPNKSIMIGEIGADQSDARGPQWYADAIALLRQHDNLVAVNWNGSNENGMKYSPLTNAKTLRLWVAAAKTEFFG